jgi:hypothetical protein
MGDQHRHAAFTVTGYSRLGGVSLLLVVSLLGVVRSLGDGSHLLGIGRGGSIGGRRVR